MQQKMIHKDKYGINYRLLYLSPTFALEELNIWINICQTQDLVCSGYTRWHETNKLRFARMTCSDLRCFQQQPVQR